MRVLHIGKFYPPFAGGIENFLGDLLPSLKRLGVDVSALVHNHQEDSVRKAKTTNFPVYRVPCYGNLLYAPVSPGFPLVLKQVIKKFRPDILHLHMPNTSAFWVMMLSCARRIPWVIHWHADVVLSEIDRRMAVAYRLYRPFEQHLLRRAATIIASSRPYLITSNALYPWRNKCTVIPLGIDSARLKMVDGDLKNWAERIWGHKRTRVLAIGRLTYYKGYEVLIRAAARAPDLRVLIVGEGGRKRRLDSLIAELGLGERVTLPGFLEEERLHALLASCDCLCLPSVERTEAFGLVLLEAMRYAKPVVASDVPGSGIGWVVKHEETGFLTPPGDSIQLARALEAMAEAPALRGRMGQAAEERFNNIYQIDRVSVEIRGVYEAILRNRS
jgi:rhamnosyl/mannosyltransferase